MPGCINVVVKLLPAWIGPESHSLSLLVVVWAIGSSLVHVMGWPTLTVSVAGEKANFVIDTSEAGAGVVPASADTAAAWQAWFEQMQASVIDRGNPIFARQSLGNCGSDTVLGGYSIISAGDLAAALALAQGSPILAVGGGVEVGELTQVSAAV